MQSKATNVDQYIAELPEERRATINRVRDFVRPHLDPRLQEGMMYGMIGWYIPHSIYPAGYHVDPKLPLGYLALAAQKNYYSLYLLTAYSDGSPDERWFREAWGRTGKKLDMGKSCLRFKSVDDLALEVLGEAIRRIGIEEWIRRYSAALDPATGKARSTYVAAKRAAPKKAAKKAVPKRAAATKKPAKKTPAKKKPARKAARKR